MCFVWTIGLFLSGTRYTNLALGSTSIMPAATTKIGIYLAPIFSHWLRLDLLCSCIPSSPYGQVHCVKTNLNKRMSSYVYSHCRKLYMYIKTCISWRKVFRTVNLGYYLLPIFSRPLQYLTHCIYLLINQFCLPICTAKCSKSLYIAIS